MMVNLSYSGQLKDPIYRFAIGTREEKLLYLQ